MCSIIAEATMISSYPMVAHMDFNLMWVFELTATEISTDIIFDRFMVLIYFHENLGYSRSLHYNFFSFRRTYNLLFALNYFLWKIFFIFQTYVEGLFPWFNKPIKNIDFERVIHNITSTSDSFRKLMLVSSSEYKAVYRFWSMYK